MKKDIIREFRTLQIEPVQFNGCKKLEIREYLYRSINGKRSLMPDQISDVISIPIENVSDLIRKMGFAVSILKDPGLLDEFEDE